MENNEKKLLKVIDTEKPKRNDDKNKTKIKLFYQNIQSVRNKVNELENICQERNINIISLSEHWLMKEEENLYVPKDFKLVTGHFRKTLTKGGTAILVNSNIKCKVINTEEVSIDEHLEISAVEVTDASGNITVINIYRTPRGDLDIFLERLESFLQKNTRKNQRLFIGGDFNVDFLSSEQNAKKVIDTLETFGIKRLVNEPTREMRCLDNVFANVPKKDLTVKIEEKMSDHCGITVEIKKPIKNDNNIIIARPITVKGKDMFKEHLKNKDWKYIYRKELSTNEKYTQFVQDLNKEHLLCFPQKTFKKKKKQSKPQWIGKEEDEMRKEITMLYDLGKTEKKSREWMLYKVKTKAYRKHLNQKKKLYNEAQITESSNKTRTAWDLVKECSGANKKETDEIEISPDMFNNYFISVQQNNTGNLDEAKKIIQQVYGNSKDNRPKLKLHPVSEQNIRKAVKQLSNSKSKDDYGLSNVMLKEIVEYIIEPLMQLTNLCLKEGLFPDSLKIARVVPIYKKGDKSNPSSYRPVSIVPVLGKVLEHLAKEQLIKHLESNGYLAENQYGYRKNKSTTLAVMKIVNKVLKGFEEKKYVRLTACDLSKAFDNLFRKLCIEKLKYLGIEGNSLNFFESYLSGTEQYVEVNNKKSQRKQTEDGTPQGSVIGGYAFLMEVNDLEAYMNLTEPTDFEEDVVAFVDDTNLVHTHKDEEKLKQKAKERLAYIKNWFDVNNFKLNNDKTQTLTFSLRRNGKTDEPVNVLGIILDSKLTWQPHKEKVKSKVAKYLYVLRKLKKELPKDTLVTVYKAMIQSIMSYGIVLYGHTDLQDLLILQKKAVRIITGAKKRESCVKHFKEEKIMTVVNLYIYNTLLYIKLNENSYKMNGDYHEYDTRWKNKLVLPQHRLLKSEVGQFSLGLKMYNTLNQEIVNLSFKDFKKKIKKMLFNNVFYSVKEYLECKNFDM